MKISEFTRTTLYSEINHLITQSTNNVIVGSSGNPPEPKLTLGLAKQVSYGLYNILTSFVKGYSFIVHAIFCHQFPLVTFVNDTKKRCELGDLLFIFEENKGKTGNALLLQAKKMRDVKFVPKGNEHTQLALYTEEIEFNYVLSDESRKMPATDTFNGAQYLMLFPPYDDGCMYRCVPPQNVKGKPLANTDFFSSCLVRMLAGEIGEFQKHQPPSDDWSKIIHDFLKVKGKNKCVLEKLKERDYSIGDVFLYKIEKSDESKICPTGSAEIFVTHNGLAVCYDDKKIETIVTGADLHAGKPFLVIHIEAAETNEEAIRR